MSEHSAEKGLLPATKALLDRWDQSTNPIFLSAAGQLRQALRADGCGATADTTRVLPPETTQP